MSKKVFVAIPSIADIVEDFQTELIINVADPISPALSASDVVDGVILGDYDTLERRLEDVIKYIIVLFKTPSTSERHGKIHKTMLPMIYEEILNDPEFIVAANLKLGGFNFELITRLMTDEVSFNSIVNKDTLGYVDFAITNLIMNVYFNTIDVADDAAEESFIILERIRENLLYILKEEPKYQDMSKELLIHCVVSQSVSGFNLVNTTLFHSKDGVVVSQNADLNEEHVGRTYQTVTDIISDVRKSTLDGQKVYNSLGMSWENPIIRVTLLDLSKDIKNISIV